LDAERQKADEPEGNKATLFIPLRTRHQWFTKAGLKKLTIKLGSVSQNATFRHRKKLTKGDRMKNFTKKQIAKMNSLEKKFGKIEWKEYVDDGVILADGWCRILQRGWMVDRDGKDF